MFNWLKNLFKKKQPYKAVTVQDSAYNHYQANKRLADKQIQATKAFEKSPASKTSGYNPNTTRPKVNPHRSIPRVPYSSPREESASSDFLAGALTGYAVNELLHSNRSENTPSYSGDGGSFGGGGASSSWSDSSSDSGSSCSPSSSD